ncbi:MAG: PaaI family thioesterase [Sporichthyaceae bacterium]
MSDDALHNIGKGLLKALGVQVVNATADRAELSLVVTEDHLQPAGLTHGGVHCTLVETAASIGAYLWVNAQGSGTVVGVSNSTDFLRASGAGTTLTAVATPIHRGRTQQIWVVEITGAEGKLVSRGQVRLQNIPAK